MDDPHVTTYLPRDGHLGHYQQQQLSPELSSGFAFSARPCWESLGTMINALCLTSPVQWVRQGSSLQKGTCSSGSSRNSPCELETPLFGFLSTSFSLDWEAGKRCSVLSQSLAGATQREHLPLYSLELFVAEDGNAVQPQTWESGVLGDVSYFWWI